MRLGTAIAAAAVVAALAGPSPAAADTVTRRDAGGDVRVTGLRPAEKRAIDVVRVSARRAFDLMVVELRMAGDVEARLGRGNLERAAAGIVLVSKAGREVAVVTRGAGAEEKTLVGSGRRVRASAPALPRAVATRDGRVLRFYLSGYRLSSLAGLRAGTIARPPRARASQEVEPIDRVMVKFFYASGAIDDLFKQTPPPPSGATDCDNLRADIARVTKKLDAIRDEFDSGYYRNLDDWRADARERLQRLCNRAKSIRPFELPCSASSFQVDIYVPSYAQPPFTFTVTDPICPGRPQTAVGEIVPGAPPREHRYDDRGGVKKIFRITVTLGGAPTTGSGTVRATVSWN